MLRFIFVLFLYFQVNHVGAVNTKPFEIEPREFVNIGGTLYYFSVLPVTDVDTAIKLCVDANSTLASMDTQEELTAVSNYILQNSELSTRYHYISGTKMLYSWMWASSGTPFTYDAWAQYEPSSSSSENKLCNTMKAQYLYDESCSINQYFICESLCSAGKDQQIVNAKEMDNTKELVLIGGRIYYFSSVEVNGISDALNTCYDLGLSLVSFETKQELQDVQAHLVSTQSSDKQYWTSGVQMYLEWTWSSTGQYINSTFWDSGEPPGSSFSQAFVYLQNEKLYATTYGNSVEIFFICEESSC